jgi:capsular exopolysaccharide synthesis family protein
MALRSVRKHWLQVLLTLVLAIGAAAAYTSTRIPIFEALATVQLDPQPLAPLGRRSDPGSQSGPEGFWSSQEYFQTQHQIITSRKMAIVVVKKLGLTRDAAFLGNRPPGVSGPPLTASVEDAAEALRNRITVTPIRESRLAQVSCRDADPARAQRLLVTLLDAYVEQNLDTSLDSANKAAEWLENQLGKLKTDLESQEMDLHDFKKSNNLLSVSFDDQSNMLRAQIQQLNTRLTEVTAQREHLAARLAVLQDLNPDDATAIPRSELIASLHPLRDRYAKAKVELSQLRAQGKGDNHPVVLTTQLEFEASRDALNAEIKNIREGVATDLAAVQRELTGLSKLYEGAKQQALGLNLNELKYSRLRRSKENTERVFSMVLERSSESGLSKLMPFNNVRVLDRPLLPGAPVSPRKGTNLAFGGALGLLLGLLGAVGRELLDRTVRNTEQVEQELGLVSVGSLPDVSGKAALVYGRYYGKSKKKKPRVEELADHARSELFGHTHPKSAPAEAARAICTNLLFMSPDRPFRTMLVTSAGPAEGKTTVSTSIAIALAQTGRRVCLVDCDLRRPQVHRVFGMDAAVGLSSALIDAARIDEAIQETLVPGLSVIPAGPTPPNPADLMHSEALGRLLTLLDQRFDKVIFDSPPVCVVTDAAILSTRVQATVLVVRALRTRRDAARRALRALHDVGANCVGFVMNALASPSESYQYSYYRYEQTPEEAAESTTSRA